MADSENASQETTRHPLREIVQPFVDAARAPKRALYSALEATAVGVPEQQT